MDDPMVTWAMLRALHASAHSSSGKRVQAKKPRQEEAGRETPLGPEQSPGAWVSPAPPCGRRAACPVSWGLGRRVRSARDPPPATRAVSVAPGAGVGSKKTQGPSSTGQVTAAAFPLGLKPAIFDVRFDESGWEESASFRAINWGWGLGDKDRSRNPVLRGDPILTAH